MAGDLGVEEAFAKVGEVGGGVGFGAGGLLHEILGEEGGAVLVDVFLHPVEEGEEVVVEELILEILEDLVVVEDKQMTQLLDLVVVILLFQELVKQVELEILHQQVHHKVIQVVVPQLTGHQ